MLIIIFIELQKLLEILLLAYQYHNIEIPAYKCAGIFDIIRIINYEGKQYE